MRSNINWMLRSAYAARYVLEDERICDLGMDVPVCSGEQMRFDMQLGSGDFCQCRACYAFLHFCKTRSYLAKKERLYRAVSSCCPLFLRDTASKPSSEGQHNNAFRRMQRLRTPGWLSVQFCITTAEERTSARKTP